MTWIAAATGSSAIVPSDSARVSATPWNSGVSQANAWSAAGSELIGKNVPENRKSGVIPNRKIVENLSGVFCVAEKAAIGAAKAIPVRTAAGIASTIERRFGGPERDDDDREDRADQRQPGDDPGEVAERDVARRDRRRVHRVEDPVPDRARP